MSSHAPAAEPLLPPLALAAAGVCVAGAAAFLNLAVLTALFTRTMNGLYSIIIQLAVTDVLLLVTSLGPELWAYNSRTWIFGSSGCVAYQGLNVFLSTASLYLIIMIGLHTIASVNLEEKAAYRKEKRSDRDEDEEIRSSSHSLVANSNSSTPLRSMNVDYRIIDTKVPVARPSIFIWVLSASLSVPEFTLATTVHLEHEIFVCTIMDSNHRFYMHLLISLFNLFIPMFMMYVVCTLIFFKLRSKRKRAFEINSDELISALKLSLWLIVICLVMCTPRSIVNVYMAYVTFSGEHDTMSIIEIARRSQQGETISALNLVFSSVYLAASLIRPVLCIFLLPRLRKKFSFGFKGSSRDNV